MIVLHIDGDEMAFISAYVSKTEEELIRRLDGLVLKYMGALDGDTYKVYLSCRRAESYRRRLFPAYKAHRDKKESPALLGFARQYLLEEHDALLHPRLEADDLLGIAGTAEDGNMNIIVSQDKDMATVPMMWYNHRTRELVETSKEEALVNLMKQVLTGDSTDGYKGCPGIGKVKASRIVGENSHRGWQKVLRAYLKKGLTRKDMELNHLMARILHRIS